METLIKEMKENSKTLEKLIAELKEKNARLEEIFHMDNMELSQYEECYNNAY